MKKVLVVSTSPRIKSNSDALAEEFIRGAKEAVFAGGVIDMGDIEGHPALQEAYGMGKNC